MTVVHKGRKPAAPAPAPRTSAPAQKVDTKKQYFLDDKSSASLAGKLKKPMDAPAVKLKFELGKGFKSPEGGTLVNCYLSHEGSVKAQGFGIVYLDLKHQTFYAQAPGVSGDARGPYALPKNFKIAEATGPVDNGTDDRFSRGHVGGEATRSWPSGGNFGSPYGGPGSSSLFRLRLGGGGSDSGSGGGGGGGGSPS